MMGAPMSLLTICMIGLGIYLAWMDVGLYLELQKLPMRNIFKSINATPEPYIFSPFKPITVKQLMLPSTIQFIDEPLGYFTVSHTNVAKLLTANMVSFLGVFVALLSAKFFTSTSLIYRQFGVFIFKIRDYMDALDGNVAREINLSHSAGQVANPHSLGWVVDGLCDGLGDCIRFIAFGIYMNHVFVTGKGNHYTSYQLLDTKLDYCSRLPVTSSLKVLPSSYSHRLYLQWVKYKKPIEIMFLVSVQSLLSSILWNYFMINYHLVLETNLEHLYSDGINFRAVATAQHNILKSSGLWVIAYFWRLINPQTITQVQLLAVLYSREIELLTNIQLLGFIPLVVIGLFSYIHLSYTTAIIATAAYS